MRARKPHVKVLGLTATADHKTEQDISAQLAPERASHLAVQRRSMDRPNIALSTYACQGMAHKLAALEQLVQALPEPGLIYCATRDHTEIVSDYLTHRGLDVPAYHAGKTPDQKRALQSSFLAGHHAAISARGQTNTCAAVSIQSQAHDQSTAEIIE